MTKLETAALRHFRLVIRIIRVIRGSDYSATCLEPGIQLNRSLEMFLSKLVHPEVLQPEANHPMVKRIVGGELVGLFFVCDCFFESAQRSLSACELVVDQNKTRIALHGIAPNRNSFLLAV